MLRPLLLCLSSISLSFAFTPTFYYGCNTTHCSYKFIVPENVAVYVDPTVLKTEVDNLTKSVQALLNTTHGLNPPTAGTTTKITTSSTKETTPSTEITTPSISSNSQMHFVEEEEILLVNSTTEATGTGPTTTTNPLTTFSENFNIAYNHTKHNVDLANNTAGPLSLQYEETLTWSQNLLDGSNQLTNLTDCMIAYMLSDNHEEEQMRCLSLFPPPNDVHHSTTLPPITSTIALSTTSLPTTVTTSSTTTS